VIADEWLVRLVRRLPAALSHLERERGLHPYLRRQGQERFVRAAERGLASSPLRWPRGEASRPRRHVSAERLARLKAWRLTAGERLGLEPDLLLPLEALKRLAAEIPSIACSPRSPCGAGSVRRLRTN